MSVWICVCVFQEDRNRQYIPLTILLPHCSHLIFIKNQASPSQWLFSKTVRSRQTQVMSWLCSVMSTVCLLVTLPVFVAVCWTSVVCFSLFPRWCCPLFIPQTKLHVAVVVASALLGFCVGVFVCSRDKVALPGGPIEQCWMSGWTTRGWMGCEVLVPPQTTTYRLQRSSLCARHRRCCVPFDVKPLSPDSSLMLHSFSF